MKNEPRHLPELLVMAHW